MNFSTDFDPASSDTEIERKYIAPDAETLTAVKQMLLDRFRAEDLGCRDQEDAYYDTAESALGRRGVTMRLRQRDGKYVAAIKLPAASDEGDGSTERFEYELAVPGSNLQHCRDLFVRYLPEMEDEFAALEVVLIVKNSRNTLLITLGEIDLEVSLDDLSYHRGQLSAQDYEVEIELRSDSSHVAGLRGFGTMIEEEFPQLKLTQQSKSSRGQNKLRQFAGLVENVKEERAMGKCLQALYDQWQFTRNCTKAFLAELSETELDNRLPRYGLDTIRKHMHEMILVQRDYVEAISSGAMSFNSVPDAGIDGSVTKTWLLANMEEADSKLAVALARASEDAEVKWFGQPRLVHFHVAALIAHESMHIGQMIAFCYALDLPNPQFVVDNWALSGR